MAAQISRCLCRGCLLLAGGRRRYGRYRASRAERTGVRHLSVACLAAALLVVGAAPASHGAPSTPRSASKTYAVPHGIWIEGHGDEEHGNMGAIPLVPPVTFVPARGERMVEVAVQDLTDRPVMVYVHQPALSHHGDDVAVTFCSKRNPAIRLGGSVPVEVSVYSGVCRNHTFGFATSGTITATFSRD